MRNVYIIFEQTISGLYRHTDIVCCGKAHYGIIETYKPGVVNLELEVLKMKIIIIFIDLLMATVLFLLEDFLSNQGIQK